MTDTWSGYKVGLEPVEVVSGKPDHGDWYEMEGIYLNGNELRDQNNEYHVYPEGWETGYRAAFAAMTNVLSFGRLSDETIDRADGRLAGLQREFVSDLADLSARLEAEPDLHIREDIMTREHMRMAEKAHGLALELYRDLVK